MVSTVRWSRIGRASYDHHVCGPFSTTNLSYPLCDTELGAGFSSLNTRNPVNDTAIAGKHLFEIPTVADLGSRALICPIVSSLVASVVPVPI
jgi:hypothetical protein